MKSEKPVESLYWLRDHCLLWLLLNGWGAVIEEDKEHVVFAAADLGLPDSSVFFLRIVAPKPGKGGLGKIPYVRTDDVSGPKFFANSVSEVGWR